MSPQHLVKLRAAGMDVVRLEPTLLKGQAVGGRRLQYYLRISMNGGRLVVSLM